MVRGKIDTVKIESLYDRKNTYRKRRASLTKKAYELSVLNNSDVALVTRHPSNNKLCYFSHPKRAEDILIRFLNMQDDDRKVNGQEFRGRFMIPNKDSLIDKLQNCKIQDDMAAAEETSIEQGNSRPITSGDDSRLIQHTVVINPQEFPQLILDYQRLYQMATPMTPQQLFDDFDAKLKIMLSHIEQRKMVLQQQEQSIVQTNAFFANMQLQQPWQQQGHNMQSQQPAHNNGHINPTGEQYFKQRCLFLHARHVLLPLPLRVLPHVLRDPALCRSPLPHSAFLLLLLR